MQVKISTRHGQVSEDTRKFIESRAEKLLTFFQRLTMIEVTVDMADEEHLVEILVNAEHKHDFVARERHREILTATDMVIQKLEKQIRKYKEKVQDHRRTPPARGTAPAPEADQA